MVILLIYMKYRPETPPNTPQHAQAAAHQTECDNHNLDSPQHCHTSHADPPQIPPLQFNNIPIPQAPLLPDPDDPFAPPPPPV